jgi:DNA polymerase-4
MIIFVHVPGFYAAVEHADRPADGGSVIVGGDPHKGGTVTSAGPSARDAGVVEGMSVAEARALCPGAELRPTRLRRYREVAAELRALLRDVSECIEPEGLASTYIAPPDGEDPVPVAARLCVQIQAELGLRAVAGVGPTRFVAHLAGQHAGSSGVRFVPGESVREFLADFPVTAIWGLGPATAEKLSEAAIETVGDLQETSKERLEALVGARNAGSFQELALGRDAVPLRPAPPAKSLSRETTLENPSGDLRSLGEHIARLADGVEEMLRRERRAARTVSLGVSFVDGERVTRTVTLERPLSQPSELVEAALQLLARTQAGVRQVRRLRLQVTNLGRVDSERQPQQLRLF